MAATPEALVDMRFNRLLDIVDVRDTTGGFCPLPRDLEDAERLAFIFEPYQELRVSGRLAVRDNEEFREVICRVCDRIELTRMGFGSRVPLQLGYRVITRSRFGFVLVDEENPDARMQMFTDGLRSFVAVRNRPDGLWQYSIGTASVYIPFPIPDILAALRVAERDPKHTWGGSETIAGCNRIHGSSLSPDRIVTIIESVLIRQGLV
ncbi:MAG: hypothetical protein NUV56_03160 [Candidatus Uhrbacteria bacterium]|nr:hypothetical protein [Candidatus Uhrbacteria bacterium]